MKKLLFILFLMASVARGAVTETNPSNINFTGSISLSGTGIFSLFQPLNSNLSDISSLTTGTFGLSLLTTSDSAALRSAAELGGAATLNVGDQAGTVAAGDDGRFLNATQVFDGSSYQSSSGLFDGTLGNVSSATYAGSASSADYATSAGAAGSANAGPYGAFGALSARETIAQSDIVVAQTISATSGTQTITSTGTTTHVLLTGTLTAPLTINLPAASNYAAGNAITFVDVARSITGTNTVTVRRAGSDTINSGTTEILYTAGAVRTFISNGSTRWKTDESIARVGSANTFASSQTFNGTTNTAPNQTDSTAGALMTRSLVDESPLWALGSARVISGASAHGNSGTAGAAAAANSGNPGSNTAAGSAAAGYGRASWVRGIFNDPGYTGSGIDFARPFSVAALFATNVGTSSDTTVCARLIIGGNGGAPAASNADALSVRGFGWEIRYDTSGPRIRLFAHNGTAYVTSAYYNMNINYVNMAHVIISSDGAGTISLYGTGDTYGNGRISRTALLTLSGGPTSAGPIGNAYIDQVAVTHSTTTPTMTNASLRIYNLTIKQN